MRYHGHRFERRDPDREKEYDEKHLADCREVKTYKLTPEEIAERYGDCKGQGEKASPLANIRNLGQKPEVDEMGKIYETSEVLEAVKTTMEKLNVTEHCLGARDIAKYLKKYEPTIYKHMEGVTGLANILGLPTLGEYKKRLREDAEVLKAKKEVDEDEFEKVYIQPYPETEVYTMTEEKTLPGVDEIIKMEYDKILAKYHEMTDVRNKYKAELEYVSEKLKEYTKYMDGFEKAAKLAGVNLE